MNRIDLHVHTTCSDGTTTPAETVRLAHSLGLTAMAVSDHDNTSGVAEAAEEGRRLGVDIVPGIEISTKYGRSVHILGYYYNIEDTALQRYLAWLVSDRDDRNLGICRLMQADGIHADYDEMKARFGEVLGRPHFGQILVEQGLASSVNDAFHRLINPGCPYYLPRYITTIEKAVTLIRDAGGIPVLAHPFQYKKTDTELRELIRVCMDNGLRGMECRYSGYTPEMSAYLEALADEFGLLKTGGSDYHGTRKPHIALGRGIEDNLQVPEEFLLRLKEAAGR